MAELLKPHADLVLRMWEEDRIPAVRHRREAARSTQPLTPEGYEQFSKYAEVVAGWDAWADEIGPQPNRDQREADARRSVGRMHARAVKEMDEKSPRQAALDAYERGGPSVEEIEKRIITAGEEEAGLQGALTYRGSGNGPSITYIVNCFRIRMSLPLLEHTEGSGDTDASLPTS